MARLSGLDKMSYAELAEAEAEIARLKVGKRNAERAEVRQAKAFGHRQRAPNSNR